MSLWWNQHQARVTDAAKKTWRRIRQEERKATQMARNDGLRVGGEQADQWGMGRPQGGKHEPRPPMSEAEKMAAAHGGGPRAGKFVLKYGKYAGQSYAQVADSDDGLRYLDWLLGEWQEKGKSGYHVDALVMFLAEPSNQKALAEALKDRSGE